MAISPLTGNSTFYDWYAKTNDEIIAQLNAMTIYGATSGDGVRLDVDSSTGILTATIGGTSGNITSGLTFSGSVSFTGEVVVPNISFKTNSITTSTPGFTFGSFVRTNGLNGYTLACADDPDNAETVGVISSMNSNYSVITSFGKITGNFVPVAGDVLTTGCVYFLDPTTPGLITTGEPVTVGKVSKPVMIGLSADTGIVLQYRGNYLSGSSTLGLSGSNRIFAILPQASSLSAGFEAGQFVSYIPNIGSKTSQFNGYLTATGRTAFDGWFLSTSTSTTETSPIPYEEDFVVGMIETASQYGSDILYQIVTRGASEVIPSGPASVPGSFGWWTLNEATLSHQLVISSNNIDEQKQYERLYVGYNYNNSSFIVDIKPQLRSINSTRSAVIPEGTQPLSAISNETFNGDFAIWQRSTARDSQYTTNTEKMYFADQWVRRSGRNSRVTQYLERKQFDKSQILVEGSPKYYIDVKCLYEPAYAFSNSYHSVGHVIPDIEALNNTDITVSFYAKSTYNNYNVDVYIARYNGTTQISKDVIGTITPTTTWDKYTLIYTTDAIPSGSYENDYIEIGFDIEPSVKQAYDLALPTGTNLVMSFASLCVYKGSYSNPKHLFELPETQKIKANKYYYTTYTSSQTQGTQTLSSNGDIALNANVYTVSPTSNYTLQKYPSQMRTNPTVSIYSPFTGALNDAYNLSANLDMRQTSGTIGYDRKTRSAPLGSSTITTTTDSTGYKLNLINGIVPFDNISYHVVADASYPL
jgi:hypothetical protein